MTLPFLLFSLYELFANNKTYQNIQLVADMIWISKLTFCGDFQNPYLSDDIMP
jgi:hypothetical protein